LAVDEPGEGIGQIHTSKCHDAIGISLSSNSLFNVWQTSFLDCRVTAEKANYFRSTDLSNILDYADAANDCFGGLRRSIDQRTKWQLWAGSDPSPPGMVPPRAYSYTGGLSAGVR